jgi:hypothetical protein
VVATCRLIQAFRISNNAYCINVYNKNLIFLPLTSEQLVVYVVQVNSLHFVDNPLAYQSKFQQYYVTLFSLPQQTFTYVTNTSMIIINVRKVESTKVSQWH